MISKEVIVRRLSENYPHLASEYGVKRIGLFGSFAKGEPDESSDVDLLVEFERPIGFKFVELAEYLETLLGSKVDLLTPVGVQGIRLEGIDKAIVESVEYVQTD